MIANSQPSSLRLWALTLGVFLMIAPVAFALDVAEGSEAGVRTAEVRLGYRVVSDRENPQRAGEYLSLDSGPVAEVHLAAAEDWKHVFLDAWYLDEGDYLAEGHFDLQGLLRFDLRSESLVHNLDHLPMGPDAFVPTVPAPAEPLVRFSDLDPGDSYSLEVRRSEVRIRGKLPRFPAHLNLGYWRLEREGHRQLTFLDEGAGQTATDCTECHIRSKSRAVDGVTDELTAGFDVHLGPIDVIFEQLLREYRDRSPIPTDPFGTHHSSTTGQTFRTAGDYQHDETPESRLVSSTIKLHTSLSGGVVGAASYTVGKRENRSDLTDVRPVRSETDFQKTAGDLTLIPSRHWTFNFRYRLLDQENDNSASIVSDSQVLNPTDVRDNIDLTRATYQARATWRPTRRLTLQGDYERRDLHRSNTGGPQAASFFPPVAIDPVWELPEDEIVDRARLSVSSRPLGNARFKVRGWYQYQHSDDPSYGTSFEDAHEVGASLTLAPSQRWGVTAILKGKEEESRGYRRPVALTAVLPILFDSVSLDRDHSQQDITASVWLAPTDRLAASFNYGFLRTRTEQDLLFGSSSGGTATTDFAIVDDQVEYRQTVHSASASLTWRLIESLRGVAETRYVQSRADFSPNFSSVSLDFAGFSTLVDSSGMAQLGRLDIRQRGLKLGFEWTPLETWHGSLYYTVDDYEDRYQPSFDGSVQTWTLSVARAW